MASGPEGREPLKDAPNQQTWVLKVSIHCEGCKKKVRKVLMGVEGVYTIDIDSKQNKVTVTGNVDADSLIRRLLKYGKHSELWSEKKHIITNSTGAATADANAKGKEKVSAASAVPKIEQKPTNTGDKQRAEESKPAPTLETTEAVKSDDSGEATAPKPNNDGPKDSDGGEPSKSDKEQGEKPTSIAEASSDANGKKNRKKVQSESSSEDERVTSSVASRQLPYQLPAYSQPIYTMSYNNIQPSTSYAYYAAPPPVMPSSYYGYSDYPPPHAYPPHPRPSAYQQEYYPSESYYSSMELPGPPAESYDMFNDENPNACNLM